MWLVATLQIDSSHSIHRVSPALFYTCTCSPNSAMQQDETVKHLQQIANPGARPLAKGFLDGLNEAQDAMGSLNAH